MGADFAYMGTRFINVTESNASEDYKQMIIQIYVITCGLTRVALRKFTLIVDI